MKFLIFLGLSLTSFSTFAAGWIPLSTLCVDAKDGIMDGNRKSMELCQRYASVLSQLSSNGAVIQATCREPSYPGACFNGTKNVVLEAKVFVSQ